MRWFYSAQKATRQFLNSRPYHLHGGSPSPQILMQASISLLFGHRWMIMNGGSMNEYHNQVEVDIISRETIKPASPTPHHLRNFKLSLIDQVWFDFYTPLILFLPNNNNNNKASVKDIVTKRSKHLKDTLSQILTRFYPVAGEIKDKFHIECNDKGVYFTEARINQTLKDFLHHPDDEKLRELTPEIIRTIDTAIGNYVIGVQVNIFNCGAIGLGMSCTHKFFDGHTYFLFMKAWAAAARASSEIISPSFVASELFPNNPSLKYSYHSKLLATKSLATRRLLFDSTAIAHLKTQLVGSSSRGPTRTEATTVIIWKAAAKAASTIRPFGIESPHALLSMVNLRKRASPPLPVESVGNIIDAAAAICFPDSQPDLPRLMAEIRKSIAKINSDHVESWKREKEHEQCNEILRNLNDLMDAVDEGDYLLASSLLNNEIYELDFGWGKPLWFYVANPGISRIVHLNDTIKGGGVEAIVTLSPSEMEIFERDLEVLAYATVNPSPLQTS